MRPSQGAHRREGEEEYGGEIRADFGARAAGSRAAACGSAGNARLNVVPCRENRASNRESGIQAERRHEGYRLLAKCTNRVHGRAPKRAAAVAATMEGMSRRIPWSIRAPGGVNGGEATRVFLVSLTKTPRDTET